MEDQPHATALTKNEIIRSGLKQGLEMDLVTRGHVEIPSSRTAGACGVEVEGCAITRQRGTSVVVRRVNRGPQVYGS
jgi:hypothetical protein